MNIKLRFIKIKLECLRSLLHILLSFKSPTDKIVVSCSQHLDTVIVKYHKCKVTLPANRKSLNITSSSLLYMILALLVLSDFIVNSYQCISPLSSLSQSIVRLIKYL